MDRYLKLALFLKQRSTSPFAWGENDCCIFAADAVYAQTGRDPMGKWRGGYKDESGASEMLREFGGLVSMVTAALASIPRPIVTTAQRGDIVLFESGNGPALGVCVGDKFAAVCAEGGMRYFSMRHAVTAWRIE